MKFTILKKMWLGFSAVLFLLVAVSIISILSLFNITNQYKTIIHVDMKKVELAKDLQDVQKETGTLLLEYIMFAKEESVDRIEEKGEERASIVKALTALTSDDQSLKLLNDLSAQAALLFESNATIIELKRDGGNFRPYSAQSSQINQEMLTIIDELIMIQEQHSTNTLGELENLHKSMVQIVIAIAFMSIVIGIVIASVISRKIATPVKKITAGLEEIANGNLIAEPIHLKNKDEIGVMAMTYNQTLRDLQKIVTNVRDSSNQLAANAEELSASAQEGLTSSQKIADISEQQMTMSVQQGQFVDASARAMQELGSSVHNIAADNVAMQQATDHVQVLVTKGADVVSNVAHQMSTIHTTFKETTDIMDEMVKHSDEIQKVTALISGISEQTNLLALNAAIEAARAGESGKGFAVVADEVRKLAEQSKASAGEIASIVQLIQSASNNAVSAITSGGETVTEGLTKTTESIEVFNEIEASVGNVVQNVQSVSAAIEQVRVMTESVVNNTDSIQALAQTVVTNATDASAATEEQLASTTEISANAQSLAELAEKLQSEVSHFKI